MGWTAKQEKAIKAAARVLQPNEQVLDATRGKIHVRRLGNETRRNGSVLVTDRRVVLFTKKVGGYEMNDFAYGLLSGLDYKKGVLFGNITLLAAGERNHISTIDKDDVERVAKAIRDRMAMAPHHSGPQDTPPDAPRRCGRNQEACRAAPRGHPHRTRIHCQEGADTRAVAVARSPILCRLLVG